MKDPRFRFGDNVKVVEDLILSHISSYRRQLEIITAVQVVRRDMAEAAMLSIQHASIGLTRGERWRIASFMYWTHQEFPTKSLVEALGFDKGFSSPDGIAVLRTNTVCRECGQEKYKLGKSSDEVCATCTPNYMNPDLVAQRGVVFFDEDGALQFENG